MKTRTMTVLVGTFGLMFLAACSSQKEPATQAVANLESSLAEVKTDGARFASERSAAVERKVDELRAALDKKDYKTVTARAPEVQQDIAALRTEVTTKRQEFEVATARATETWNGYAAEMPRWLETLQKRVDALAKRSRSKDPSEDSLLLANVRNLWAD